MESLRRAAGSPAASPPLLPTSTGIVESLRYKRSPGSSRFLGLYSSSNDSIAGAGAAGSGGGVELHEHEVLWTTSAANPSEASVRPPAAGRNGSSTSPFGSPSSRGGSLRRGTPDRSFGILEALPEEEGNRSPGHRNGEGSGEAGPLLQRKTSISSLSSISSLLSSNSNSPSSTSSLKTATRKIPALPKPKTEYNLSVPAARGNLPQSAPVKVPLMPNKTRIALQEALDEVGDYGYSDEDERLPPHEIVARSYARSLMSTFSVLEGAGRTLKGRDLRQVRNAVLRQTGILIACIHVWGSRSRSRSLF